MSWSADPEFAALFHAEMRERLGSLESGLMELETHAGGAVPRDLLKPLQRDIHTVKGTARMAGADDVVSTAHQLEDVLSAVADGRVPVSRPAVDTMLTAVSALVRLLPGEASPLPADTLTEVAGALAAVLSGEDTVVLPAGPATDLREPATGAPVERFGAAEPAVRTEPGAVVRVAVDRVHDVLDSVGDTELAVRRLVREARSDPADVDEELALLREARAALLGAHVPVPAAATDALASLATLLDRRGRRVRERRGRLEDAASRLTRVREGAMGLATAPVSRVTRGMARLVRDVAAAGGRDVTLVVDGSDVELDVRVLDGVAESLRHLVTNAVDHGCETPAERTAVGKAPTATVTVCARTAGSAVVIEVSDDGRGVDLAAARARAVATGRLTADADDERVLRVLLDSGFSTREEVTAESGRGVGLDVVRSAVVGLGGEVDVHSTPGEGTRIVLTLPVTLGIARCLVVRSAGERWAVPLGSVLETVALAAATEHEVAGARVLLRREESIPLLDLAAAVGSAGTSRPRVAVVARGRDGTTCAWAVDAVESERETVVKELGGFLGRRDAVVGATVDDDGRVVPLLDVRALSPVPARPRTTAAPAAVPFALGGPHHGPVATGGLSSDVDLRHAPSGGRPRVLVVEDSVGVRELQRSVLEAAGFAVSTAVDGLDGVSRLGLAPVDLVITDVEMPGMDGFTLTRTLRATRGWESVPVVIMTSRGNDADRRAGLDAGADEYLLKSEFAPRLLVDTVHRLLAAAHTPVAVTAPIDVPVAVPRRSS